MRPPDPSPHRPGALADASQPNKLVWTDERPHILRRAALRPVCPEILVGFAWLHGGSARSLSLNSSKSRFKTLDLRGFRACVRLHARAEIFGTRSFKALEILKSETLDLVSLRELARCARGPRLSNEDPFVNEPLVQQARLGHRSDCLELL